MRRLRSVLFLMTTLICAPLLAQNSADILSLIRDKNIRSIDQLLLQLPTRLREQFVLMYRSGSLQGASFQKPRMIFFTPEAKLILAVTGSADQANGHELEMIDFDDESKSFHFHQVRFPADAGSRDPIVHQADPALCLQCHRQQRSPNWESYPVWPGAFGSMQTVVMRTAWIEQGGLNDFRQSSFRRGRYRALPNRAGDMSLDDFHNQNLSLSTALGSLNQARLIHDLHRHSGVRRLMPALAAIEKQCPDLTAYFPKSIQGTLLTKSLGQMQDETLRDVLFLHKQRSATAALLNGGNDEFVQAEKVWNFAFAIEKPILAAVLLKAALKFDLEDDSLSMNGGIFSSHESLVQLLPALIPRSVLNQSCEQLLADAQRY